MGRAEVRGQLCCRLISDSILRLFYFYPTWSRWCNSLNKKTQKELYERRQQQIGDEDVSLIFFLYFLGSTTTNGWGNFPWIQLKWLNPPVKVFTNILIVSWYMCGLIWYLKALTMVSCFGGVCWSPVFLFVVPFRSLLYFGMLLTERAATSERTSHGFVQRRMRGVFHQLARCCHFAGHCLKKNELPSFVGRVFFFTHASPLFPVRGL